MRQSVTSDKKAPAYVRPLYLLLVTTISLFIIFVYANKEKTITAWKKNNKKSFVKMQYKGLGVFKSSNIFGYLPVKYTFSLKQEYHFCSPDMLRIVYIDKIVSKGYAECTFEDYYENNEIRAIGRGRVAFNADIIPSCTIVEYFEIKCYDRHGKILSNIVNGNGNIIFVDQDNNIFVKAKYFNKKHVHVSCWDRNGLILYDSSPPIPKEIMTRICPSGVPVQGMADEPKTEEQTPKPEKK